MAISFRSALASVLRIVLGRRTMVRMGRFLSNWGRLDVPNAMRENGELATLEVVVSSADRDRQQVFMDVGANVGDWTLALLDLCRKHQLTNVSVHCFEPHPETFATLTSRVKQHSLSAKVNLFQLALSSEEALQTLFVVGSGSGTNSLHSYDANTTRLSVPTVALDDHAEKHSINTIRFAKVDTEGHDARVIRGANRLLRAGRIDALQFEYNFRWILSRQYLKDVFDLDLHRCYEVGKITPLGFEGYRAWHPELETFREGNYLICARQIAAQLPRVDWWNASSHTTASSAG